MFSFYDRALTMTRIQIYLLLQININLFKYSDFSIHTLESVDFMVKPMED